jgi:hypothetical protein
MGAWRGRESSGFSNESKVNLFRPVRVTILLFFCIALGVVLPAGRLAGFAADPVFVLKFAAMVTAAFGIGYLLFRSFILALSAAVAPLPGAGLAALCLALSPISFSLGAAFAYALGFSLALVVGNRYAARIAGGETPKDAVSAALRGALSVAVASAAVTSALLCLLSVGHARALFPAALFLAAANAAVLVSAYLVMPFAASLVPVGEDFIAASNRIGEAWARRLDATARISQPPWNWSAAGIFAIFMVLAWFGGVGAGISGATRSVIGRDLAWSLASLFLAAVFVARDWRRALAVWASAAGALLMGVWGMTRSHLALNADQLVSLAELMSVCFVPIAAVAAGAAQIADEDSASASQAGISSDGAAALSGIVAALVLLAPWYREAQGLALGCVLAIVFAAAAALVFQSALTRTLEAVIPRRRSLAERYRLK